MNKSFKKTDLQDLLFGDVDSEDPTCLKLIEETLDDTDRWTSQHTMVFQDGDKCYETYFSKGLTEMQDERPFEYEPDEIECIEVHEVEVTTIVWKKVKD